MISRRLFLAGAAGLAAVQKARAHQLISVLVGAQAGSVADEEMRRFLPFLARHLPRSELEIRNSPGSAGLIALRTLADVAPTGDVLGWASTPTLPARVVDHGADELMHRLRLLGAVQKEPIVIVSPPATPLGSAQDIVQRSADDADAVPLGTPPPGSPPHLAALRLQAIAGTRLNIIAFPSSAAARQAAVAGNVAAALLGMTSAIADLRENRVVGLGIAAKNRADEFPDMPALRDSGLNLSAYICRGLAAPAALPDERAAQLIQALQAVVADPEFRAQADASGFRATFIDGPAWTATAQAEFAELSKLWATEPWLQESG